MALLCNKIRLSENLKTGSRKCRILEIASAQYV